MCKKNSVVKDLVWSFFVVLAFYPMLLTMGFWKVVASENRFETNEDIVAVIPGSLGFEFETPVSYSGASVVDKYPDTDGVGNQSNYVFVIAGKVYKYMAKIDFDEFIRNFEEFVRKFETDGGYEIYGSWTSKDEIRKAYARVNYWNDYYHLDEKSDSNDKIAILSLAHGREDAILLYDAFIYTGDFLWAMYYLSKAVDFIFLATCEGGIFLQNVQDLSYRTQTARDVFTQLSVKAIGKKTVGFEDECAEIIRNVLDYIQEMQETKGNVTGKGIYDAIYNGSYSHPIYADSVKEKWIFLDYYPGTLVLWSYGTKNSAGGVGDVFI